jgi:hypothetical protein
MFFLDSRHVPLNAGAVAILTLAVREVFEHARRKAEERRWYAEHFLKDKIDSLRRLHAALLDWGRELNYRGNMPPQTFDDFARELNPRQDEFMKALAASRMYLSASDDETICRAMGAYRMAHLSLYNSMPDSAFPQGRRPRPPETMEVFPWVDFMTKGDTAAMCLARLLNPKVLKRLEGELDKD